MNQIEKAVKSMANAFCILGRSAHSTCVFSCVSVLIFDIYNKVFLFPLKMFCICDHFKLTDNIKQTVCTIYNDISKSYFHISLLKRDLKFSVSRIETSVL